MILLLSVRLLNGRFHGLAANGDRPDWPPSCFRLFQAIVAGNARSESIPPKIVDALKWLEALPPPVIVVPASKAGRVTLTYVLNNTEGRSRTPKYLRPTLLNGDCLIEFAWQYDTSEITAQNHARVLLEAVRHIRAFGWGIDLAIGHGSIQERLPETSKSRSHFFPREHFDAPGIEIRVPKVGSLDSLVECFQEYLARFESSDSTLLESGSPLYQPWPYTAGIPRPFAAFHLLPADPDDRRPRTSFRQERIVCVAAMLRHAACEAALNDLDEEGWRTKAWADQFVAGHGPHKAAESFPRFSYLPIPTLGHGNGMVYRALIAETPGGDGRSARWAAQRLGGAALRDEDSGQEVAVLRNVRPEGEKVFEPFLRECDCWQTVTPIILPGFDDNDRGKASKLLLKCFEQACIPCETIADWEMQKSPWSRASAQTRSFMRTSRLEHLPAWHVRISFTHPIAGPLAIGAGRHRGLGIMAARN